MNKFTERSFLALKPGALHRALIGVVIKRLERIGLKIVGMKFVIPNREDVRAHYLIDGDFLNKAGASRIKSFDERGVKPPTDDTIACGEMVLEQLIKQYTSAPILIMVWEGPHAIKLIRKLLGCTECLSSDVGTIRGDYGTDSYQCTGAEDRVMQNILHASGTTEEARMEIDIWFKKDELMNYKSLVEHITYGGGTGICW